MRRQASLAIGRTVFGLLALAALGTQLAVHVQHHFSVVNFFSYFTNLSNMFAALVLLAGAILVVRRRDLAAPPVWDLVRGAAAAAMAIVGIVYGVLLRNEDLGTLLPWVNIVVHFVMPVAVVLDWLYDPPRSVLTPRQVGYWLIYPVIFVSYSLLRGAAVGWYPYPFLNPSKAGGYGGVALYCVVICIAFVVVGWLLAASNGIVRR